jgi:methylated-DNA-protein-cysteine methyltransferase-like protein
MKIREKLNFNQRVYSIVSKIPKGKVMCYGAVAALADSPRASRAVGYALHNNPDPKTIFCHRVVFKDGSLTPAFVFGGKNAQYKLLKAEGITFKGGKVNMDKHHL